MSEHIEVIVVGAGPVGLLLAAELRRHGASARIIDKSAGTKPISKALIHHVRTQEALDGAGVIGAVRAEARPLTHVEVHAFGRHVGAWRLDKIEGPYSGPVIIGQNRTEALLEKHAADLGVHVEWKTQAVAVEQDVDGARVTVRRDDGVEEVLAAAYVVGCEGSDSVTRKSAGFTFEGERYTGEQFIQADAKLRWAYPRGASHLFLTAVGYMMVIEMPGDIVRVFVSLPDTDPGDKSDPTLGDVQDALRRMGSPEAELYDPVWLARYRTSHRSANTFRNGRLFVAGDAGHVHVPIGGQGMNTGLQDAFNLGWKLASVARGRAPDSLLDSYAAERVPIAEGLLRGTDKAYRFVLHPGALGRGVAKHLGPTILGMDAVQEGFRTTLEEIALNYRDGPISEDRGGPGKVRAGDRAPDAPVVDGATLGSTRLYDLMRGPKWSLLFFAGPDGDETAFVEAAKLAAERGLTPLLLRQRVDTTPAQGATLIHDRAGHAHDAYGVNGPATYLIRPDWSVGFRGPPSATTRLALYFDRVGLTARGAESHA